MYYFHLKDDEALHDVDGTELADVAAARDHAIKVAHELKFKRRTMLHREWSHWRMSVRDDADNELFSFGMGEF